ncbi:tautomerase family protein [Microbacterium sp. K24]|uniref:tautomerase family protein n=1 Tax=Microbacterium sp. K24 TaxID=2305446 RepID=UPI0014440F0D|nr:tautomerase family protein [Microbacterium sp. K24]
MDAIYRAQRSALLVPEDDRNIRYVEHRPEHFAVPSTASDKFVLVEITLFPGRSVEAKTRLHRAITANFGDLGIAPDDIFVVLNEPTLENWAVGGVPGSELQISFSVDV